MPTLTELRKMIRLREGRGSTPAVPLERVDRLDSRGLVSRSEDQRERETAPRHLPSDDAGMSPGWGNLEPGDVSEWVAAQPGCGAAELALSVVRPQLRPGARWLVIDPVEEVHPLTLQRRGVDLARVLFLRPTSAAEALWGVEQGLRSRGVDIVWCRLSKLAPIAFRRIKLAAEAGESRCLLMRPPEALREGSWADRRLKISSLPSPCWSRRRMRVDVLKVRNGFAEEPFDVELDHETGAVRVVPQLADPADRA